MAAGSFHFHPSSEKNIMKWAISRFRGLVFRSVLYGCVGKTLGMVFGNKVPCRDFALQVPDDCLPNLKSAIFTGFYEYSEKILIRRWLPAGLDCVELGASIGYISTVIHHHLDPGRKMACVEALPELAALARSNLSKAFEIRNKVIHWQVLEGAIGYDAPHLEFSRGSAHNAGSINDHADPNAIRVTTITLKKVLDSLDTRDYSLVMDIEGAEHALLAKETDALDRCQCAIVELHGSDTQKMQFIEKMKHIGLRPADQHHTVHVFTRK